MPKIGLVEPSRKQVEFAKREGEILKAATSLFEGPRWETVTVEQISKKAKIGKGTVYKHFTCKEEIYANIATKFSRHILDAYDVIDFESQIEEQAVLDSIQQLIRISFDLFLNLACRHLFILCVRVSFEPLSAHLSSALPLEFVSSEPARATTTDAFKCTLVAQNSTAKSYLLDC